MNWKRLVNAFVEGFLSAIAAALTIAVALLALMIGAIFVGFIGLALYTLAKTWWGVCLIILGLVLTVIYYKTGVGKMMMDLPPPK